MLKIRAKKLLSISCLVFFNYSATFAQTKICEIKYKEKGGEKTLESKMNAKGQNKYMNDKFGFDCYIIGLEHDIKRKPISNKPIYACCKN